MTTAVLHSRPVSRVGALSVLSVSLTAALAAITHAYEFGPSAFVVGGAAVGLLVALGLGVGRTRNKLILLLYVLLNMWIIGGFGVVGGLWNHAVKLVLSATHGGALPRAVETWFISPEIGSAAYETAGVLTFVASLGAAVFGLRFVRLIVAGRGARS